jgi:hypothetical protein
VFASYVAVTVLAAAFNGLTATANLIGHDYPRRQAAMLRVPRSWVRPLGTLLAAGALGLLAGFVAALVVNLAYHGL